MLYYLFEYLDKTLNVPGAGVFQYITLRCILAALSSLLIALLIGPNVIRKLIYYQIGENIRIDGPKSHLQKSSVSATGNLAIT